MQANFLSIDIPSFVGIIKRLDCKEVKTPSLILSQKYDWINPLRSDLVLKQPVLFRGMAKKQKKKKNGWDAIGNWTKMMELLLGKHKTNLYSLYDAKSVMRLLNLFGFKFTVHEQCDQIWKKIATLARCETALTICEDSLSSISQSL